MYILIAVVSACAFALQGTLMASVYRSNDVLSTVAFRGLALGLTMLPLLFFVPKEAFAAVPVVAVPVLIGSVLGALGNWFIANAYRRLPIGVASALCECFRTVTAVALAVYMLGEMLSTSHLALLFALVLFVSLLSLSRRGDASRRQESHAKWTGVFFTLLFGVAIGGSMSVVGSAARDINPFLLAFMWEVTIGLVSFILAFGRGAIKGNGLSVPSLKTFGRIMLFSAPTVIGTLGFSFAVRMGSIAIVSAVLSISSVVAALIAFCLYRERLSPVQCTLIALSCMAVAGLNMS